jgi:hypothetical protein
VFLQVTISRQHLAIMACRAGHGPVADEAQAAVDGHMGLVAEDRDGKFGHRAFGLAIAWAANLHGPAGVGVLSAPPWPAYTISLDQDRCAHYRMPMDMMRDG